MARGMSELRKFGWGDDVTVAVVRRASFVPEFVDGDCPAVAAYREERIIAYVQAGGQIRPQCAGLHEACARDDEALAGDLGERAGIGRRDRANQVVDALRGLRPVDPAVFRLAAAEVAAVREIVRQMRRF